MFKEIGVKQDDYKKFYEQFGKCLKLGIREDSTNRYYYYYTKIAVLMRCQTSKSGDEQISLKDYVDRMKESQNYVTGDSITCVSPSPSFSFEYGCMFLILILTLYGFPFVWLNRPLFVRMCRVLCLSICVRAGSISDPLNMPII